MQTSFNAKAIKDTTSKFFEAVPKELDEKGYYDWASANIKR